MVDSSVILLAVARLHVITGQLSILKMVGYTFYAALIYGAVLELSKYKGRSRNDRDVT